METKIFNTMEKYNMFGAGFVVGLSGGADSVALLHFLAGLDEDVLAVHVNHGLRGEEATADAQFCKMFCKRLEVPLEIYYVDAGELASTYKVSVEYAGRLLRYDIFKKLSQHRGLERIATAHHKNDVAETVLMQLLRGTGRINGIPPVRENIVRPLIDVTREEIEEYCAKHNLPYCSDSTNFETEHTRNKIRLETLPMLAQEYNPNLIDTLARFAEISRVEDVFLDKLTPKFPPLQLWVKELAKFDLSLQRRAVRHALSMIKDLTQGHVDSVLSLMDMQSGKSVSLPGDNMAKRQYDTIVIRPKEKPEDFTVTLPLEQEIYIIQARCWFYLGKHPKDRGGEETMTIALASNKIGQLDVRRRRAGDKVHRKGVGTKKLKEWLIDQKIPGDYRDWVVLVANGDDVIAITDGYEWDKFAPEDGDDVVYLQIWD
ncbi:MAG: tRNA lysidine(34) synthetase TilS [Defluviitaleaceae bacterium]|nr:tRNA lysidine(34) synthetase TilS [Defluviitaleaceae bacterium]